MKKMEKPRKITTGLRLKIFRSLFYRKEKKGKKSPMLYTDDRI